MNWFEFQFGIKVNVTDPVSEAIIEELGKSINNFYIHKGRRDQTKHIKDTIALLGHRKYGYKVYANGLSESLTQQKGGIFINIEWMYDLHWYKEGNDHYTTVNLPLVMECEWQHRHRRERQKVAYSGIKYDFQKLLITNAEYRLMVFKIVRLSDLDHLMEYFNGNINGYKQLPKGAKFLFVGFYHKKRTFYYHELFKQN